ncbi:MAG: hypothetical protein A2231_08555 [Candidatus Firestonebacteria bacterium RIFOXYA2_FULL_40_8]|nr:MAG: hypothetical protein A2231_08555 [Candidatus Firestonebacteria bacterium RIFOXYA2_FULL_40_8]
MMIDDLKTVISQTVDMKGKVIKPEIRFVEDLGADYLDMVEVEMAVEDKFNIEILSDKNIVNIKTVADLIKIIKEKKDIQEALV